MTGIPLEGLILAILPFLGKFLLGLPFVHNKLIPFILLIFNYILKYWLILGFPTQQIEPVPETQLGAIFAFTIPWEKFGILVWSLVEQYFAHRFYEGKRAESTVKGEVSWWEKGKDNYWR